MTTFLSPNEAAEPLRLTVRFTTAVPDLLLDVIAASETSVIALKHRIRSQLPPPTSQHRFRLIHSGKLLQDDDLLSAVLKIPSAPPPRIPDLKGKGKAVEPPAPRVYINCSIGDVLTAEELGAEALAAEESSKNAQKRSREPSPGGTPRLSTTTTTPAPRGFDRLLAGGFTAAEVNQLRLQFRSIQSNIHTPDTMPSADTMLRMEDAWIDDNGGNTGAGGSGAGGFEFGEDGAGALDDLLWGNVMGFLWPLGALAWVIREEGVWSRRRKMAVFTGFVLSLSFGFLRIAS